MYPQHSKYSKFSIVLAIGAAVILGLFEVGVGFLVEPTAAALSCSAPWGAPDPEP